MTDTFTRTEADMAEAWQTLEEAALTLGISSRTLHRRLARNEFQTRMENGRREVLVVIEDREPSLDRLAAAATRQTRVADEPADTSDTSANAATPHDIDSYGTAIDHAADEVQQTMLALHEDRIRRTDLAIMAYQQSVTVAAAEARRAVTRSRVAWSVAAVLTVIMFLAATWATHRVTQAHGEVRHLSDNVRQLTDAIESKSREVQELRQDSQVAKVAAARAEGELAAAKRQVDQLTRAQEADRARLTLLAMPTDTSAIGGGAGATTQPAMSASATTQSAAVLAAATQPSATTRSVGQ